MLAGWAGTFFSTMPLGQLFGASALATIVAAVILMLLLKPVKGLMAGRK
jgi:hypothetical protein